MASSIFQPKDFSSSSIGKKFDPWASEEQEQKREELVQEGVGEYNKATGRDYGSSSKTSQQVDTSSRAQQVAKQLISSSSNRKNQTEDTNNQFNKIKDYLSIQQENQPDNEDAATSSASDVSGLFQKGKQEDDSVVAIPNQQYFDILHDRYDDTQSGEAQKEETMNFLDFINPNNLAENLFGEGGMFDFGKAPLIGTTDKQKELIDNAPNRFNPMQVSSPSKINQYNLLAQQYRDPNAQPANDKPFVNFYEDDMTFDPNKSRSNTMSGEKYLWYQNEMGLGGRPAEEIDPNGTYSKDYEYKYYGFDPVIEDQNMLTTMSADEAMLGPNHLTNALANIRENVRGGYTYDNVISPYGSSYDKIDGDLLTQAMIAYDFDREMKKAEESGLAYRGNDLTSEMLSDPNYVKMTPYALQFVDDDGTPYVFEGVTEDDIYDQIEEQLQEVRATGNQDLPIYINFIDPSNGEEIEVNFPAWQLNDGTHYRQLERVSKDPLNDKITAAYKLDPLVLEDGTEVDPLTAQLINDGEIGEANYGFANLNKPRSEVIDPIEVDENGNWSFDFSDIAPFAVDVLGTSLPYMINIPVTATGALSNMYQAAKGVDARSEDEGVYQKIAEDPSDFQYWSNIIGEGFIPASEYGLGYMGKLKIPYVNDFFSRLLRKINPQSRLMPYAKMASEIASEGMEEVLQNPAEEMQHFGEYAYANQIDADNDGYLDFDATGHEVRDMDTPWSERLFNMYRSMPNDFFAGAGMAGGLTLMNPIQQRNAYKESQKLKGLQGYMEPSVSFMDKYYDTLPEDEEEK